MTITPPRPVAPAEQAAPPVTTLALAEARRYARHPLFLLAGSVLIVALGAGLVKREVVTVSALEGTVAPAFLIGVFGFVIAHRLTTSMHRTGDVVGTTPTTPLRRTAALCLACVVPASAGVAVLLIDVVFGAIWPPEPVPPGQTVAWFGDQPTVPMLAALVASIVLACLGGPLLGVAVARWAPFRGSALLGVVLLVVGCAYGDDLPGSWFAVLPWFNFSDSLVTDGIFRASWLRDGAIPVWTCVYYACLCGLAAVAALLRDAGDHRRTLLTTGAILAVGAVLAVTFSMS